MPQIDPHYPEVLQRVEVLRANAFNHAARPQPLIQQADSFLDRYVPAYGQAARYAKLDFARAVNQLER